jgi:hypothetical protein
MNNDRDKYIKINWSKISSPNARNFFRAVGPNENPMPKRCDSSLPEGTKYMTIALPVTEQIPLDYPMNNTVQSYTTA